MAGDNLIPHIPERIRRRTKKPRSKSYKGAAYMFTSNISGYSVAVYKQKGLLDGDAVGYWDPETHEIGLVLPAPSPMAEADRMLHEHIHAMSNIVLPIEMRLNEFQVNAISTTMVDALTRYSELRDFLLSRIAPAQVTP